MNRLYTCSILCHTTATDCVFFFLLFLCSCSHIPRRSPALCVCVFNTSKQSKFLTYSYFDLLIDFVFWGSYFLFVSMFHSANICFYCNEDAH